MRPRGRFGPLRKDGSCGIKGDTFEVGGPHIESKDKVMVKHSRVDFGQISPASYSAAEEVDGGLSV
jgi:hypothetical protein